MKGKRYTIYRNGKKLDTVTRVQGCKLLYISGATFSKYAASGEEYVEGDYRYRIVEEETKQTRSNENLKRQVLKDWDEIRFRLNPKLRDEQGQPEKH